MNVCQKVRGKELSCTKSLENGQDCLSTEKKLIISKSSNFFLHFLEMKIVLGQCPSRIYNCPFSA